MKIIGYSERGMINALFYEIDNAQNNTQILSHLLNTVCFPYKNIPNNIHFQIKDATILIEQSFSDFGDSDVVLLIDNNGMKQTVFIEAKVKTYRKQYDIDKVFQKFTNSIQNKKRVNSSNLFSQLYYKVRLFDTLKNSNGLYHLQSGVMFPSIFNRTNKKIGENKIVLNATQMISNYLSDAFYIILVPDNTNNLKKFFLNTLKHYQPTNIPQWHVTNWGYLTWKDVELLCSSHGLSSTLNNFRHNNGQIY